MEKSFEQWSEIVLNDLQRVYPEIRKQVEVMNITLWGHAMAQPLPGLIWGETRQQLSASIENKIHFAHTDLAGVSIFEEAFYQGLAAAEKVMSHKKKIK